MSINVLKTKSGTLNLPIFFPDATKAVIKGVSADDLEKCNVDGLVVNTYHALNDSKVDIINAFSGLHNFMGYTRPIITDSGGFQVMSLIHENPKNGKIDDTGILFKGSTNETFGNHIFKEIHLTPESCIETQIKLGSDIIMCLDDCTNPLAPLEDQIISVDRTIKWAKQCKEAFVRLTAHLPQDKKPLIFAIVQGGDYKDLRKKCAEALVEIGFDGYAYGGWPVNEKKEFLDDIVEYTAKLMPEDKPKYCMGVGKPRDIIKCIEFGYNMFDCVLPTRDARHKRFYYFTNETSLEYSYFSLSGRKFDIDTDPISHMCDCITCENYSKGYLAHLFNIKDATFIRLATIHNLRFYAMLMERIRKQTQMLSK